MPWNTFNLDAFIIMDTNWHNYLHTVISSTSYCLRAKKWDRYTHHFQTRMEQHQFYTWDNILALLRHSMYSEVIEQTLLKPIPNYVFSAFSTSFPFRFTEAKCDMWYRIKSHQGTLTRTWICLLSFTTTSVQFNLSDFSTLLNRQK